MNFIETKLQGAYVIERAPNKDDRGSFERVFCKELFDFNGLSSDFVQVNLCKNLSSGIVRGMHYQLGSAAETKLVQCVRGAVYDVIIDVRKDSDTYLEWFGIELSDENGRMVYVPRGFAHGYMTLTNDAHVSYMVDNFYDAAAESGLRYDDPIVDIIWPEIIKSVSEKDNNWRFLEHV